MTADPPISETQDQQDFFVSYTKVDEGWAMWVAYILEVAGYSVRLQAWDFRPGHNFVLEMHKGLKTSRRTVLILSNAFIEAMFTQPEWAATFATDPTGAKRKLIPVRIDHCAPDGLLSQVVWIDLVSKCEADCVMELLDGVLDGRTRLKNGRIPFPGNGRNA